MFVDLLAKLLAKRRLYAVNRFLWRVALRGMGFDNWRSLDESGETWVVSTVLKKALNKMNPVCLDVGAHTGEYSELILSHFPQATIHAFEPHPITFKKLIHNVENRIHCHQMALGSKPGQLELFDRSGHDGSVRASLSREALETVLKDELVTHQVQVSSIDAFLEENAIPFIDFLKVDTEGFEMDVFEGAAKTIAEGNIGAVQFEFNQLHVCRRQFLRDFQSVFSNYSLFRILPDGLVPLDLMRPNEREIFAYQNILALPKDIAHHWS